ncbi:GNAT family N-acetyltransferase [Flavobacterium pallidum]|uniref:GNAT family N-acetyltransferase n=1 Tax=Flavobacterium pallidum TaxID=2172098 RepID=A0A2S1SHY3_9FLAO|nr:GNAT family N-acetyltransferase [Flavobacterium pallidum]AWI25991.1 GNAT family N-acetyltransferase [Flavobacterium pallidum]
MHITEAQPNEFNLIQYIVDKTWPVAYGEILSKAQLDYMIALFYSLEALNKNVENGHRFYFAKDDDAVLGFLGIEHHYKGNPVTRIHKIYMLPESQGKGVGKLLIEKAAELAKENQSEKLSLNVNRYNPAIHFYEKLGFENMGSEDVAIGNGYLMEDYMMEKQLS